MSQLVNLEWNVFTGHDAAAVRATLLELSKEHRPHVITGLEFAHQNLDNFPGYQLLQEDPIPQGPGHLVHEEGDTALLVRNDVTIRHQRLHVMTEPWTGPKNDWPHSPRRYRSAWLRLPDGMIWKFQCAHWPTGGPNGRNASAVRETSEFAANWLRRTMPGRPTVLSGDLNLRHDELAPIAKAGRASEIGTGPDHALFRNCTGRMEQLGQYGSDHHAYLFTFNAKETRQ